MSTLKKKSKIYSVMSQKGGVGKTTLAINLAVQSTLQGNKALIIDIDPQASATTWGDIRDSNAKYPLVISSFAARLSNVIQAAQQNNINEIFIDTPPHSQRDAQIAAEISDKIVIPCRPNLFDLHAIDNTIGLAQIAGKPFVIVFNAIHHTSSLSIEAKEAISNKYKDNIDICPYMIVQRLCYVHAITSGQGVQEYEPKGKAMLEIGHVYKYINKHEDK
ncbi:ParA family protein [Candidatus Dojkabacteria bacterium]|uniref:ParA family protein n=1 Tax=Candidatus Dojkabacteria bacterium TaxID=2099670 RepID=A0A955RKG2_9BACT|nr:ParA family protein [Candidatus Dojkabacteria bacterium]